MTTSATPSDEGSTAERPPSAPEPESASIAGPKPEDASSAELTKGEGSLASGSPSADAPAGSPGSSPKPEIKSPWLEYVTSTKGSPKALLKRIEKTGRVPVPAQTEIEEFARVAIDRKNGFSRVLALLQALPPAPTAIRQVVEELASRAAARELGLVAPDEVTSHSLERRIGRWLDLRPKRPLPNRDLQALHVILHVARARDHLDEQSMFRLVHEAVTPLRRVSTKTATKRKKNSSPTAEPEVQATPGSVLLSSAPTTAVLRLLCSLYSAAERDQRQLQQRIAVLEAAGDERDQHVRELQAAAHDLQSNVQSLEQTRLQLLHDLKASEERLAELDDGYRHKMQEIRGRLHGTLEGKLTRWLQTALQASEENPPWTHTIQERLEEALALIEKETKWLQPSA